jgi:hypothetical protein
MYPHGTTPPPTVDPHGKKLGAHRAHRSPGAHPLVSSRDSLERRATRVPLAAPARTAPSAPPRTAQCRPSDPIGSLLTPLVRRLVLKSIL